MRPLDPLRSVADAADIAKAGTFGALRSGLARPRNPVIATRMLGAFRKWGTTPALGFSLGAVRDAEAVAIVDADDPQTEEITFAEAEYRTTVLANSLLDRGAQPGTTVGILGRNSRAYAETIVAVSRTGADLVYLNTGSTPEQVSAVCAAHDITMLIHDREFDGFCVWVARLRRLVTKSHRTPARVALPVIFNFDSVGFSAFEFEFNGELHAHI